MRPGAIAKVSRGGRRRITYQRSAYLMDIQQLPAAVAQDEEGATVTIYQKNGDPYLGADGSPATITVTGKESKRYANAEAANQRRFFKSRRTTLEPADIHRNRIALAAAAIVGWTGWEMNGAPYPFTPDNAATLLAIPHILSQVERGIEEHADFFTKREP